ncbi:hypothetical protein HMPREF9370_0275 [Neisseria wadsworthii 9715]|uniref:Uncharacterized protein n=1 Tax=Neisseria wadsworthii 9715 TaxID=1030841 RepID=G4CMG6_9NEIS|nr:hypothetical protein HMPREF9370_0275 [Neisseria wadsworthii 9715]
MIGKRCLSENIFRQAFLMPLNFPARIARRESGNVARNRINPNRMNPIKM